MFLHKISAYVQLIKIGKHDIFHLKISLLDLLFLDVTNGVPKISQVKSTLELKERLRRINSSLNLR